MEKKVFEILVNMQSNMKQMQFSMEQMNERLGSLENTVTGEMNGRMKNLESTVTGEMNDRMKNLESTVTGEMNDRLKRIESTVDRIEQSQTEDVIGLLKTAKKNTNFEVDYVNNKLTELDKRIFSLEKRVEN